MLGPVLVPLILAYAGWASGDWTGAVVGLGVGLLVDVAVVAGAASWARRIGSLLDPGQAFDIAPRPPGFRALCDWVYRRTLG